MKTEDFKKITDEMNEKIGKENASKIADSMAKLISDNVQINKELKEKDEEISKLNNDKEILMETNMSLLQQVPMGEDTSKKEPKEKTEKEKATNFDYKEVFDEFGNFKK